MPGKLLVGAGHEHWQGWTTLDADPTTQPDIVAAVPPLPPEVLAGAWDEIALIHTIEHFSIQHADEVLRDCYAALRPGGQLTLEQPNIEFCMRVALGEISVPSDRQIRFGLLGIFGEQDGSSWMAHRWGYTPDTLIEKVRKAGFGRVQICTAQTHHVERDFRLEAFK